MNQGEFINLKYFQIWFKSHSLNFAAEVYLLIILIRLVEIVCRKAICTAKRRIKKQYVSRETLLPTKNTLYIRKALFEKCFT